MNILLLGDSLFARHEGKQEPHMNFSLKNCLPGLTISNLAQSGDNSYDLLEKVERSKLMPVDLVFIWIGANDLATHKQVYLGEFQDNLRRISQALLADYGPQQLIFLGPAPVDEGKQVYRTNRLVGYYSQMVEKVAKEYGLGFVSMQEVFAQSNLSLPELLEGSMDDGLHFGERAYDWIAQCLAAEIKKRLTDLEGE